MRIVENMKITEKTPPTAASGEWHLRIFAVRQKPLDQGQWKAHDVCSPFWRFYANDRDGMEMELLDAPNNTARFALKKTVFTLCRQGCVSPATPVN
jgi:hypothetical protein